MLLLDQDPNLGDVCEENVEITKIENVQTTPTNYALRSKGTVNTPPKTTKNNKKNNPSKKLQNKEVPTKNDTNEKQPQKTPETITTQKTNNPTQPQKTVPLMSTKTSTSSHGAAITSGIKYSGHNT